MISMLAARQLLENVDKKVAWWYCWSMLNHEILVIDKKWLLFNRHV
jgi:hypothetical protein